MKDADIENGVFHIQSPSDGNFTLQDNKGMVTYCHLSMKPISTLYGRQRCIKIIWELSSFHVLLLDGSASLLVKHSGFWRSQRDMFLVPIEIKDSGDPPLSSTDTLTVSLCHCEAGGAVLTCHITTGSAAGLSTPALLAILACAFSLLGKYPVLSYVLLATTFCFGALKHIQIILMSLLHDIAYLTGSNHVYTCRLSYELLSSL